MKNIEKTYEDFTMWYKLYQFKRDGIRLEKDEIVKMIAYFERIEKFGKEYFNEKTILEISGIGVISNELSKFGAKCTVYEGRKEHIDYGSSKYKNITYKKYNLDLDRPSEKFDIVLDFGIFYHLNDPISYLKWSKSLANEL